MRQQSPLPIRLASLARQSALRQHVCSLVLAKGGGMRGAGRGGRNAPGENVEMTAELTLEEAFKGVRKRYRTNAGKVIEVNFPPGVHSGSKVRVKGEGRESAKGGPSGDLLLTVKLSPHPYYTLEGEDLILELPLSPAEAVLGAQIEVPTLAGKVRLTIPKGTSSGKVLRLAGKGLKKEDNSWGDQLVKIRIDVPAQPSPQERELYEKLAQFTAPNLRSHLT
jgi:curved DNA-binding protein